MKHSATHRFALPSWLSRSGHRPSPSARILFIILAPVFFLLVLNAAASAWVEGVIYPGVSVAGKDVSGLTRRQAYGVLQSMPLSRRYRVSVGDKVFEASNAHIGAEYDLNATVDLAYSIGRESNLALLGFWQAPRRGQLQFAYRLDYAKLQRFTSDIVSSVGKPPKNAGVVVENGLIRTVPDEQGMHIRAQAVMTRIAASLGSATDQAFTLEPQPVQAPIRVEQTETARRQTANHLERRLTYQYEQRQFSPTPAELGHWIKVAPDQEVEPKNLVVTINPQEVRGYIQSLANTINKTPVNKKVMIRNGETTIERDGKDGLAMDQEAALKQTLSAMEAGRDAVITIQTQPVAFKTETSRTTVLDHGKYIEINLSSQRAWAYENGKVVYSTPITSGATGAGLGTVTGLFSIYYKTTNTYLNGRPYGYNYNVFVKYWMPFYLGYGLHDASWRGNFGGSDYYYGGSHGCVNLPDAAAAFLYKWSNIGTPVWVHT